jgi:hypothetical protein
MRRLVCLLIAACSHPVPLPAADPPPPNLAPHPVVDAAPALAPPPTSPPTPPVPPPPDAAVGFRDYVVPPVLILEPATPASKACVDAAALEGRRAVAALDAELRKTGGAVLPTRFDGRQLRDADPTPAGTITRGFSGERLMVVGSVGCGQPSPTIAIDGKGVVFVPQITLSGKSRRAVHACNPECGGCGVNMPPNILVAEVPANATFDPRPRTVKVPIDIEVQVIAPTKRCMPRP